MGRPIIIAGGGIGGLVLGNALRMCNIPFVCLEQSNSFRKVGGGIGLWGPALKALRQIGIESELNGKHLTCAGYRISSQIQRNEWLVRPQNNILDRHTSCLCIRRADLQSALFHSMQEGELRLNAKVVSFTQNTDSVSVTLENGEVLEGSLLVAADGIHSTIASTLFPSTPRRPCGYYYWQGIAPLPPPPPDSDKGGGGIWGNDMAAYEAWHPGIRFGMVPLPHNECFWFVCSDTDLPPPPTTTPSTSSIDTQHPNPPTHIQTGLSQLLQPFGTIVESLLLHTPPSDIYSTTLIEVPPMTTWSSCRVTCLGDAVHGMAPNLAQGACLAIEDALELAHQLHRLNSRPDHSVTNATLPALTDALRDYERRRWWRVYLVQFLVPLVHTIGACSEPYSSIRNGIFHIFPDVIKTCVFDCTHQMALGWRYTPPNLGQGLYHRLLDKTFLAANVSLSTFHAHDVNRLCSGNVVVERGRGVLCHLLGRLLQLPPPTALTEKSDVSVQIHTDSQGVETWRRIFSYYSRSNADNMTTAVPTRVVEFTTRQSITGEDLVECYGPCQFHFRVMIEGPNQFRLSLREMWLGIPLSPFLVRVPAIGTPQVDGWTVQSKADTGWMFDVHIRGPRWTDGFVGLLVRYHGEITRYSRDMRD